MQSVHSPGECMYPAAGAAAARTLRRRAFGAHPRCSDRSSAFDKEGRYRGPCTYVAYGRSLVRNSPRGWAPKTLPITEVDCSESRHHRLGQHLRAGRHRRAPRSAHRSAPQRGRTASAGRLRFQPFPVIAGQTFRGRPCAGTARAHTSRNRLCRRRHPTPVALPPPDRIARKRAWGPPSRRVPHKRAAVGHIDTWAAVAAFLIERGGPV